MQIVSQILFQDFLIFQQRFLVLCKSSFRLLLTFIIYGIIFTYVDYDMIQHFFLLMSQGDETCLLFLLQVTRHVPFDQDFVLTLYCQGLFQQLIGCNNRMQSHAFYQNILKFCTFLSKFSNNLLFFVLFKQFFVLFLLFF